MPVDLGPSRRVGFTVVTLTYAAAALVAWAVTTHSLLSTFVADFAATLVVFAVSTIVGNASLYDAYWSVAPAVIVPAWILWTPGDVTARQAVLLILVLTWAIRLTANWARSWQGLHHEDWRYAQMRTNRPPWLPFWLVNLFGIQLMPTLIVFAVLLPAWPATTLTTRPWSWLDTAATATTAAAILLESTADRQLHRFARNPANRGQFIDEGLWHFSRHPNYVGEMLFWWGIWLFGLAAAPSWWWTIVGPLAMVALFTFISVPLMDRRSLSRRPSYADHMRRVSALVPLRVHRPH